MIFDSHLHIINPRFPLIPNQGFVPEPFTCEGYRARANSLDIAGGCVVSGSFQGFDQTYLLSALETLGPGFVGVTQLPAIVTDEEILALDNAGVRAVRFNIKRGGSASVEELPAFAKRVYALVGWHIEIYVDGSELPDMLRMLLGLPKVVIDHLGLSHEGLPCIYKLVERGVFVKASGFGRLDFNPVPVLGEIASINPDALLFGTDLPSTRAQRPFNQRDIQLIEEALEPALARRALYDNGIALYRPRQIPA